MRFLVVGAIISLLLLMQPIYIILSEHLALELLCCHYNFQIKVVVTSVIRSTSIGLHTRKHIGVSLYGTGIQRASHWHDCIALVCVYACLLVWTTFRKYSMKIVHAHCKSINLAQKTQTGSEVDCVCSMHGNFQICVL